MANSGYRTRYPPVAVTTAALCAAEAADQLSSIAELCV